MQISVSYLSSYYSNEKTVMMLESTSADYIHVDLMDGGFVTNRNFTIPDSLKLLKNHEKPLDIHLMTFDPIIYINDLAELKPEYITFHLEATKDIVKTIETIRRNNIKVGLSIKPATNIIELMPYLALVDLVLLMSVEPGAGGQNFIYHIADKLQDLIKVRKENNLNFKIAMDGGLNEDTIKLVKGLDIAVVGSYICKSNNYEERIKTIKGNLSK